MKREEKNTLYRKKCIYKSWHVCIVIHTKKILYVLANDINQYIFTPNYLSSCYWVAAGHTVLSVPQEFYCHFNLVLNYNMCFNSQTKRSLNCFFQLAPTYNLSRSGMKKLCWVTCSLWLKNLHRSYVSSETSIFLSTQLEKNKNKRVYGGERNPW